MVHRLPPISTAVDNGPIAIRQSFLIGDLANDSKQVPDEICVAGIHFGQRLDRELGNNQHVSRRLRIDIAEGQTAVVLVDDVGRDLFVDDLLKDGRHVGSSQW